MHTRSLALALILSFACFSCARSQAPPEVFLLHINQPVNPALVTIDYQVNGEKGGDGYASFGRAGLYLEMTTTQDIPISLKLPQQGGRATALRAVLFCRGYGLALVNVPSLAGLLSNRVPVDLVPLGMVALRGRVALPSDEKNPEELRLDVYYDNLPVVFGHLQRSQGMWGNGMRVSTTTIAADGSFTTEVPDFANDPVVTASQNPGRLNFVIRALRSFHGASERSTAAGVVGQPDVGPLAGIPMAPSYSQPVALELRWP